MHWCMDETLAVLAMIPIIGIFFRKLHTWWHTQSHHKCHEKDCNDTHVEHCHMPGNIPHGKVSEGQCKQHPLVVHDEGPEPEEWFMDDWTAVEPEYVEARFGGSMMDDLIGDEHLLQVDERPRDEEFNWFINEMGDIRCIYKTRIFVHDFVCHEHGESGWSEVLH